MDLNDQIFIEPLPDERPAVYADRLGRWYITNISTSHKKEYGQFLTPVVVADFMAGLVTVRSGSLRILDPGLGAGILSCALAEAAARWPVKPAHIELLAYELDPGLASEAESCLHYLKEWLTRQGITFSYKIKTKDFILANAHVMNNALPLFPQLIEAHEPFDVIISNPPYFKISKSDQRAMVTASAVYGQPNIYALFMIVSAALLKLGGEFVFITPRSYAAGPYFRAFRKMFFSMLKPEAIHLFGSRTEAFDRDEILQENIILKARREKKETSAPKNSFVHVSHSEGVKGLHNSPKRKTPLREIINRESRDMVLCIPVSPEEDQVVQLVNSWEGSLHKYHMEISTGPVVPFRATQFIVSCGDVAGRSHAPLLWMQNIKTMSVSWPVMVRNKQQYIKICRESAPLLVANRNYVLICRFSAKEDHRRLTAAPLPAGHLDSMLIGLENHLNYIHRPRGDLSLPEMFGLSALFNCKLLDIYFRTFNGNTQVSATELRSMPLPPHEAIEEIGQVILKKGILNINLEELITDVLGLKQRVERVHG
ncbi:MAG: Eco57I restriction-modification methylase domain-containing protein [bacterium]